MLPLRPLLTPHLYCICRQFAGLGELLCTRCCVSRRDAAVLYLRCVYCWPENSSISNWPRPSLRVHAGIFFPGNWRESYSACSTNAPFQPLQNFHTYEGLRRCFFVSLSKFLLHVYIRRRLSWRLNCFAPPRLIETADPRALGEEDTRSAKNGVRFQLCAGRRK